MYELNNMSNVVVCVLCHWNNNIIIVGLQLRIKAAEQPGP